MTDKSATSSSGGGEPIFISVRQAAQRLGMETWDVYELVKRGEIAHVQHKPKGKIHVYAADVPRWAAEKAAAAVRGVSA